jgi:hypothetical protein
MTTTINADDGVVSGSAGLKYSSDSSGVLALQTNGTTAVSISTGQVVTLTNALPVASGGSGVTTSTGTGDNVLGTTPSFTSTIGVGGATASASGAGITFPATQSASTDVNTLDDYEEGTWTPSIGGTATYTTQAGTYSKVGNIVTLWFDIQINVLGTGTTTSFSGLPYLSRVSPNNPQGMAGAVGYFVNIATSSTFILVRVDNNATAAQFSNTAGVTTGVLSNAIFGNGARTTGTITYQANA